MFRIHVRLAHTPADFQAAHALVEHTYQHLGYIRGSLAPLVSADAVLLCLHEGQLVGTGTLLLPADDERTGTELEFGHTLPDLLPPGTSRADLVEIKRFAKTTAAFATGTDLVFLALTLATVRFALSRGRSLWVATLKPDLVNIFERLGFPLVETARTPELPRCLELLDGNYYTEPGQTPCSVYCDMHATATRLRRFELLLARGSIILDAGLAEVLAPTEA